MCIAFKHPKQRGSSHPGCVSQTKGPSFLDGLAKGRQAPDRLPRLTCDAFGVLPPVSKLTSEQAKTDQNFGSLRFDALITDVRPALAGWQFGKMYPLLVKLLVLGFAILCW